MCDSDCVSARSYEEEVSARVLLEDRIQQVVGLIDDGHDETTAQHIERLAYVRDLLNTLVEDPEEFGSKLEKWSLMLHSRSEFIK